MNTRTPQEITEALDRINTQLGLAKQIHEIHDDNGWDTRRSLALGILGLQGMGWALLWVAKEEGFETLINVPSYTQEDVDKAQKDSDEYNAEYAEEAAKIKEVGINDRIDWEAVQAETDEYEEGIRAHEYFERLQKASELVRQIIERSRSRSDRPAEDVAKMAEEALQLMDNAKSGDSTPLPF